MSEPLIAIMLPPFVACLILTGIHTYLGLHVVSRGVIFVDLALAQIAALGSTFAFLMGFDPSSPAGYIYSLLFTFIGAATFSLTRLKDQRVPQEALIGIAFAISSAAVILIADRAPQGAEHVQEMLTGSILWVNWSTVWTTLLIYLGVGLFHFVFRRKFLTISMNPGEAERQGWVIWWWDFLFYVSFGFVITSSVAIAGVLLVFCFLIIPSVIGMLFSNRTSIRLFLGWGSGTVVSLLGLLLSYQFDLPSGPSVVCTFGGFLILSGLIRYVAQSERRSIALAHVAVGVLVVFLLGQVALQSRPGPPEDPFTAQTEIEILHQAFQELESDNGNHRQALATIMEHLTLAGQGLADGRLSIDQSMIQRLGELGLPEAIPFLQLICDQIKAPWTCYYASLSLFQLGDQESIHRLVRLLKDPSPPFLKVQVRNFLRDISGRDFGFEEDATYDEQEAGINRWEVWWHEHAQRFTWDEREKKLRLE